MSSEEFSENEDRGAEYLLELITRFEELISTGKNSFFDADELEEIVEYYIEKNNSKKSLQAIEFALGQYPFSTIFYLRKAQIFAATNQSQKALEILSYVESMEPSNAELFMTKGSIYSQMGLTDQAIENFKKAAENTDEIDEIYLAMAFEFENTFKFSDAIYYLKKAIAEN